MQVAVVAGVEAYPTNISVGSSDADCITFFALDPIQVPGYSTFVSGGFGDSLSYLNNNREGAHHRH